MVRALLTAAFLVATSAIAAPARPIVANPRAIVRSPFSPRRAARPLPDEAILSIDRQSFLAKRDYVDLRKAVTALLREYNPDQHFFIGTGRDPAPLIAALQNLGGERLAMNFPASNITGAWQPGGPVVPKIAAKLTPKLFGQYFKRLIPDAALRREILRGDRVLVLLDQSNSGKTPATLEPFLRAYLDSIGSKAKTAKVAFGPKDYPFWPGVTKISTGRFPEVAKYNQPSYEGIVSQYPRHVLGVNAIEDLVEQPGFGLYKAALKKRMQEDTELHRFLTEELGVKITPNIEMAVRERLAREEAQRQERARIQFERVVRTYPVIPLGSLKALIAILPVVRDRKRPTTLTPNAVRLANWLERGMVERRKVAEVDQAVAEQGPQFLTRPFVREAERALREYKIQPHDYRLLQEAALRASTNLSSVQR